MINSSSKLLSLTLHTGSIQLVRFGLSIPQAFDIGPDYFLSRSLRGIELAFIIFYLKNIQSLHSRFEIFLLQST